MKVDSHLECGIQVCVDVWIIFHADCVDVWIFFHADCVDVWIILHSFRKKDTKFKKSSLAVDPIKNDNITHRYYRMDNLPCRLRGRLDNLPCRLRGRLDNLTHLKLR